ncbi:MAG: AAA family ATPase [Deltaproteobacteria bacterium]
MAFTIAMAGKGGVGKTTLCGFLIRYLIEKKKGPVLAVDADANSNLHEVLGIKVDQQVGTIREDSKHRARKEELASVSNVDNMELMINQALIEAKGVDLISMGRPEGPGCYCFPNHVIRRFMDKLSDNYPYVVMDNEAGLEHLSRRTTQDTDLMLIVSDPSARSLRTVGRVKELIIELELRVHKIGLIVNRAAGELPQESLNVIKETGVDLLGVVRADETLASYDLKNIPLIELPQEDAALKTAWGIFDGLNIP